jgi:hypothetical protein
VHDLFDIVGLSRSAPPVEVRRACARAVRRLHPDFGSPGDRERIPRADQPPMAGAVVHRDVAVDFVEMTSVLDRMQRAFFHSGGTPLF